MNNELSVSDKNHEYYNNLINELREELKKANDTIYELETRFGKLKTVTANQAITINL